MIGAARMMLNQVAVPTPARRLFGWGGNAYGQLGDGTVVPESSPVQIGAETDWSLVSTNYLNYLAVREGKIFSSGINSYGMLGLGDTTNRSSPTQVGALAGWTKASIGLDAGYGIRSGRLFAWGLNSYGQLGTGDVVGKSSPVPVGAESDWSIIIAGNGSAAGIRGGKLFAWGRNDVGQLGDGTVVNRSSPVQIGAETDWTSLSMGKDQLFAIRGGKLFSCGYNDTGTLGLGDTTNRSSPVQVGAATDWSLVAGSAQSSGIVFGIRGGKLFTWGGLDDNGQMGINNSDEYYRVSSPVQIGAATDWTAIGVGQIHTGGIRGGLLYMWGSNGDGRLGLGAGADSRYSSPVQVGAETDWNEVAAGTDASYGIKV